MNLPLTEEDAKHSNVRHVGKTKQITNYVIDNIKRHISILAFIISLYTFVTE